MRTTRPEEVNCKVSVRTTRPEEVNCKVSYLNVFIPYQFEEDVEHRFLHSISLCMHWPLIYLCALTFVILCSSPLTSSRVFFRCSIHQQTFIEYKSWHLPFCVFWIQIRVSRCHRLDNLFNNCLLIQKILCSDFPCNRKISLLHVKKICIQCPLVLST